MSRTPSRLGRWRVALQQCTGVLEIGLCGAYFISLITLNIGRYNEITIDPTTLPKTTIRTGSSKDSQRIIAAIATAAGDLGVKLADIGGDLSTISATSNEQLELFSELSETTAEIAEGNKTLRSDAVAIA